MTLEEAKALTEYFGHIGAQTIPFEEEKAKYYSAYDSLDWHWKIPLPQLVLAINDDYFDAKYRDRKDFRFAPGRTWYPIRHQTNGIGCAQHYMVGTVLAVRPEKVDGFHRITHGHRWCWGAGEHLPQVNEYNHALGELLGVNCHKSFKKFQEGIYPIDLQFLGDMCADFAGISPPEQFVATELDFLTEWPNETESALGWRTLGPLFHLYILGDNCD